MNLQRQSVLRSEHAQLNDSCQRIDALAASEGNRALTATEQSQYDTNLSRMGEINDELGGHRPFLPAVVVGDDPEAGTNLGRHLLVRGQAALGALGVAKYAGAVDTLQRALQHGVSGDGISPVTIEGDLVKFVDANRYAVNASRRIPMPDNRSQTFERPRLTQSTQVDTQAAQGDVLASRRITTTGDTITKVTKGGTLALSEQEIDWTEPAMLGLAIQDLAEQYAIESDSDLTAAIEAKVTTNNTVVALDASAADFVLALAEAQAAEYATSKKLPDVLYAGTNRWAYLLGLTDNDGRPLYANIGAQVNAGGSVSGTSFGGNVGGLVLCVDPNFDPDFLAVAASQLVEFYEQDKGLLNVDAPSTLEVIYAYRGYVAANPYAQGLQGLNPA